MSDIPTREIALPAQDSRRSAGVAAVIFEGGHPVTEIDRQMASVRAAVVLDHVELLRGIPGVGPVVVATNHPSLGEQAEALGAVVDLNGGDASYHFGRRLAGLVRRHGWDAVLYLGGAAAPLLDRDDVEWICRALWDPPPGAIVSRGLTPPPGTPRVSGRVVVNNPQSPDVIAFAPAGALPNLPPPDADNALGHTLRAAGFDRVLTPNDPRIHFDLDTPADLLVLARQAGAGPRTRAAVAQLNWPRTHLERAVAALRQRNAEVALIGRVGPSIVYHVNETLPLRLRVFSEERGMKGMGREARGEVRSLLAALIRTVGPELFFRELAAVCDAAFIDTRVLFAHWKGRVSDADRYASDLGRVEEIEDPDLRSFTAAAGEAPIPVVMGGHSLVSGGFWLLVDEVARDLGSKVQPSR